MSNLNGKVALVTGAGSKRGMGRRVAVRLAQEGANVAVMDKFANPKSVWPGDENWGGLDEVVTEIKAVGKDGLMLVADVCSEQEVNAAVAKTIDKFGKIDILVHCGGIRGAMTTPIVDLSAADWKTMLDINLTGSFLISKAVAKTMIPNGEGKKIVLIGSKAATEGYRGSAGYCASKHGVLGLGRTLALELAQYKINVNIINPGAFDTNLRDSAVAARAQAQGLTVAEMLKKEAQNPRPAAAGPASNIPLGRMGTPEDIANLVSFLVSDQASYITGEMIDIDGGV
jgi:NAD(P)-dependent dehydrogenase (short-subunit alcohol dehydrogenase family)